MIYLPIRNTFRNTRITPFKTLVQNTRRHPFKTLVGTTLRIIYLFIYMIAITVSTNYHDILEHVLPNNAKLFDKWIIVTHQNDHKTINTIRKFNFDNVQILFFDFYSNGKIFNKGGAIRFAQQTIPCDYNGPLLLLDSDILLPNDFKQIVLNANIGYRALYGVTCRYDFYSYDNLILNKIDYRYTGFHGFFQLYRFKPNILYKDSYNCAQCDLDFNSLFHSKIRIQ
jgi:hypothetical protein